MNYYGAQPQYLTKWLLRDQTDGYRDPSVDRGPRQNIARPAGLRSGFGTMRSGIAGGRARYSNSGLEPGHLSQPVNAAQKVRSRSQACGEMSRQSWSTRRCPPPGQAAGGGRSASPPYPTTQKGSPPGEHSPRFAGPVVLDAPSSAASFSAASTSSTCRSRWQRASGPPARCTRRYASPVGGSSVANSPERPLGADSVEAVPLGTFPGKADAGPRAGPGGRRRQAGTVCAGCGQRLPRRSEGQRTGPGVDLGSNRGGSACVYARSSSRRS
jgi:hypothetical protein